MLHRLTAIEEAIHRTGDTTEVNDARAVDGDFQLQYQAAERAYGASDYPEARRLASDLLNQLSDQPQDPDTQAAVLGWRAFIALLLGHIELYGLENPAGAIGFYQQVLNSQPQETLAELAQQGLERCQLAGTAPVTTVAMDSQKQDNQKQDSCKQDSSDHHSSSPDNPSPDSPSPDSPASKPATAVVPPRQELPELLRDPFLKQQPSETSGLTRSIDETRPTAMPWLDASAAASTPELELEPKAPLQDVPQSLPEQAMENFLERQPAAEPLLSELTTESIPEPTSEPPTDSEPSPTPTPTPAPTPSPTPPPAPTPSPAPTPTPTQEPQAEPQATAAATSADHREPATAPGAESEREPTPKPSTGTSRSADPDPAAFLAGSLLRVTIQPRPNNESEATPLDRPAKSLLLRLLQRLSRRR